MLLTASLSHAQKSDNEQDKLHAFLLHANPDPDEKDTYFAAFVDLNGDGKREAMVYLMGPAYCGSGGCPLSIYTPAGASYKLVTKTTVTQLPIQVLTARSHGWNDLSVYVSGGGITPGYHARLRFNGRTYPRNPTVPPAVRLAGIPEEKPILFEDSPRISLAK